MSDPWLKFYPTDWRADPALRMCSAAARGVWIDLICLMHEATPYGHLLVNGRCPTDAQVAVLTGTPPDQLTQCLRELEDAGVFSRTKDGTIYSRKLTRMAKKAATARNNGRKGGNPSLEKQRGNPPLDNPADKGRDKPQKPEARSQIEVREEANASLSPRGDGGRGFAEFWSSWPLAKVQKAKAEAAFKRLSKENRGLAIDRVGAWAAAWRKKYPQASDIHPTTYLNGKRWQDDFVPMQTAAQPVDIRSAIAERIKSGKSFLVRDVSISTARDLIAAGLVTEEECRKVGIA
jgi:hypothetical protein